MNLTDEMKEHLLQFLWNQSEEIEDDIEGYGVLKPLLPLMQDVNSMFYWYPIIEPLDARINYPKTTLIPYEGNPHKDIEERNENWIYFIKKVGDVADEYGYPVFIRTGGTSNKHDWKDTCYLERREDLEEHVLRLFEFTLMVMGVRMDFDGIIIREFLNIEHSFTAFNGMPVGKEFRVFVRGEDVECYHPYWPPSSISRPSIDDWNILLIKDHELTREELFDLTINSERVSCQLNKGLLGSGYWSLDWCYTTDGEWYLTDLARGENSFHWPACEHASEEMKRYGDPYDTSEILGPTAREERNKLIREKYRVK